ncbi:hypothetical protein GOP47_0000079 [Adiantum capillus-veneris]|uniref:Uncharacterized protein n=1 Tax=Adiantum capillus-veneris TaxID=13818 RepID=A0A9D4VCC8_ADICA|nr:hypothetical protein GOP47_0000079 [Adiantum capillus-veneris]
MSYRFFHKQATRPNNNLNQRPFVHPRENAVLPAGDVDLLHLSPNAQLTWISSCKLGFPPSKMFLSSAYCKQALNELCEI